MKAWIATGYGGIDVLRLVERPTPQPAAGEVLVRVAATTVSSGDWRLRSLTVPGGLGPVARLAFGLFRPRQPVLGTDLAGTVEAVGTGVTRFAIGNRVLAFPGAKMGAHAEFCLLPEDGRIVPLPDTLSFTDAVALPFGGTTALTFLRRAELRAGETMLLIGASGAVGVSMLQLARIEGVHVTAVSSAANRDLVLSLGADDYVDYGKTDPLTLSQRFDIVADCVGATTFRAARHLLKPGGRYLAVAGGLSDMLARPSGRVRPIAGPSEERREDPETLVRLATAGKLKPVIDTILPFADLPAAHERVATGRKRGAVVVTVL